LASVIQKQMFIGQQTVISHAFPQKNL